MLWTSCAVQQSPYSTKCFSVFSCQKMSYKHEPFKKLPRSRKLNCKVYFCDNAVMTCDFLERLFYYLAAVHVAFQFNLSVMFIQTKCTSKYKKRFTGISNINTQELTSVVMCLFCGKVWRYKGVSLTFLAVMRFSVK